MTRAITDLSWHELSAIAEHAGAVAIEKAHDAGLSTYGLLEGHAVIASPARKIRSLEPAVLAAEDAATRTKDAAAGATASPPAKPLQKSHA